MGGRNGLCHYDEQEGRLKQPASREIILGMIMYINRPNRSDMS
jgi:hypothetical protein